MQVTGQPFVDVGMAVAAHLMQRRTIDELSSDDLRRAVQILEESLESLGRLKVLSAYWQNNPLTGINPGQLAVYQKHLHLLTIDDVPTQAGVCQTCGRSGVYADANRSWFPLAASADSDPCSLPNLRGKFLCADCFRAIVLLPMGCKFCKAGPYFFHLIEPDLQVEAMNEAMTAIDTLRQARASGTSGLKIPTKLSGRLELLEIVSGSRLWDQTQDGVLSHKAEHGATIIAFSNSGTSPAFDQLRLPAQALEFFAALWERKVQSIFIDWADSAMKRRQNKTRTYALFDRICDDIEMRRSIAPLLAGFIKAREKKSSDDTKGTTPTLLRKEKDVLQIYEDVALGKRERFETLERIATRINEMDTRYRDSLVKQLGNVRSKDRFLQLLKEYAKSEKTNLRLSAAELQILDLDSAPAGEAISLLYLLCVAEQ